VAFFSAYPVIKGDMGKLQGQAHYQNYDAHFVPVVPSNPNNPNEKVYVPCAPEQQHLYIEVVVFESTQCLPRYVVKLKPELPMAPLNLLKQEEPKIKGAVVHSTDSPLQSGEQSYQEGMKYYMACQYLKSLSYFEVSAQLNYPAAYLYLGQLYAKDGKIGPKNETKKQYWYQKAAESFLWFENQAKTGDVTAQLNLGICYYESVGARQDYLEAVKWFQKAANQGYAHAQCNLGLCYENGQGVRKDDVEAVKWYQKAAEQGDANAQYHLGSCYKIGKGVNQNDAEAIKWIQKAAEQGDVNAQSILGIYYQHGLGVKQNEAEAIKWFMKAIKQGSTNALCALGSCYYYGEGVKQDYAGPSSATRQVPS
jgi:TPR repeat protein